MSDIDPAKVRGLIGCLRHAVRLLRDLAALPPDSFLGDEHLQSSAKYNFIAAIEAAIDIASHVISRKGLRTPRDYADTFQVLHEDGAFDAAFAGQLCRMARFRNRLVHRYWDVDANELSHILAERLDDFDILLACLGRYLSASGLGDAGSVEDRQ